MFNILVVICDSVAPPGPATITESTSMKEPAALGLMVRAVPPSMVQMDPAVVEIRRELSVISVAPQLM